MSPDSPWIDAVQPAHCSAAWRDRYGQLDGILAGLPPAGASAYCQSWSPSRYPDQATGASLSASAAEAAFADRFPRHRTPCYEPPVAPMDQ
jgi:hypothetical protein